MDSLIYETSGRAEQHEFLFSKKQWIELSDTNNGNYNSAQVQFDGSALNSALEFPDWKQSFTTIPLVTVLTAVKSDGSANLTEDVQNAFALSMKNGNHQLINSLVIKMNDEEYVSVQDTSNVKINYELINTLVLDDYTNYAELLNFVPDTSESEYYVKAGTAAGIGLINNSIAENAFDANL